MCVLYIVTYTPSAVVLVCLLCELTSHVAPTAKIVVIHKVHFVAYFNFTKVVWPTALKNEKMTQILLLILEPCHHLARCHRL